MSSEAEGPLGGAAASDDVETPVPTPGEPGEPEAQVPADAGESAGPPPAEPAVSGSGASAASSLEDTAELPQPAAVPTGGEPEATTAAADAETSAAATASDVSTAADAGAKTGRRSRALGVAGQAVGVIGIVVSLALIVAVLLGRGWAVDRTDEVAASVNGALTRGVTLVDTASTRVSEVSGRLGGVVDAANAMATQSNPAPGLSAALSAQLQPIEDKYLALRSAYTDVKSTIVSAFDRLQTLDRLLPFISIPQGPVDALTTLDGKFQDLDAKMTDLFTTPGSGAVNAVAAGIATRASNLQGGLESVTTTLDDVSTRVTALQVKVQDKADQAKLLATLAAIVLILLFVYLAFLHWVLFRASSRVRRGVPD